MYNFTFTSQTPALWTGLKTQSRKTLWIIISHQICYYNIRLRLTCFLLRYDLFHIFLGLNVPVIYVDLMSKCTNSKDQIQIGFPSSRKFQDTKPCSRVYKFWSAEELWGLLSQVLARWIWTRSSGINFVCLICLLVLLGLMTSTLCEILTDLQGRWLEKSRSCQRLDRR